MRNFEFCTPTRVIFGKDTQKKTGELIRKYGFKKVLIHYGGGSVIRSGLLDQVTASLKEMCIRDSPGSGCWKCPWPLHIGSPTAV